MKKLILFLTLLPTLLFAQTENTNIKWSETTFDFGNIPFDIPATHEFTFTNLGNDTLRFYGVEASCGCTTPVMSSNVIAPKQSGYIRATFNAKTQGQFSKQVSVSTSRSAFPFNLILRGNVIPQTHTEGDGHTH